MPQRKFNAGSGYRYGFNGKENDNEVKGEGSQQDYGMRIYDPRLGKFLSVDPVSKSFPMLTPYQFASNTPIQAIDLDGLESFGAGINFKLTIGSGAPALKLSIAAGVSFNNTRLLNPAMNIAVNISNSGLGHRLGQTGRAMTDLVLSPSVLVGGGTGEANPVNTFTARTATGVSSTFKYGIRFAENFVFNSRGRNQVVGDVGVRIGQLDLHMYNDINSFPFGGDDDDRFNTGGGAIKYNLGRGNFMQLSNDVYTGEPFDNKTLRPTDPGGANEKGDTFERFENGRFYVNVYSKLSEEYNAGETSLSFSARGVAGEITQQGRSGMFIQNFIHAGPYKKKDGNFHFFKSLMPNKIKVSVGVQGTR